MSYEAIQLYSHYFTVFCCVILLGSAYAKLGMIASAFTSDSDDITKLLNVSLDLIAPDKPKGAAVEATMSLDKKAVTDSEHAVEVLNFLASKTKVSIRQVLLYYIL